MLKLYNAGVHNSKSFEKAIDILQAVPRRSSCHHGTIFGVLEACPSFKTNSAPVNQGQHGLRDSVEHAEVIYAIKLTICELESAYISIPRACEAFRPLEEAQQNTGSKGQYFGQFFGRYRRPIRSSASMLDEFSPEQVMACKNALYNMDTNGWTTHTQFLAQVHQLCEASRDAVNMGKYISKSSCPGTES